MKKADRDRCRELARKIDWTLATPHDGVDYGRLLVRAARLLREVSRPNPRIGKRRSDP